MPEATNRKIETNFGYIINGIIEPRKINFILVAPHAAGDDRQTDPITAALARELNCHALVNNKFKKQGNKHIEDSNFVEDFNRPSWNAEEKIYEWDEKKREMHEFYRQLSQLIKQIKQINPLQPVSLFIHGMKENSVEVDLGCGARYHNGNLIGTTKHPQAGKNTGIITLELEKVILIKHELIALGISATIGQYEAAWRRNNGVQLCAGLNCRALQIELSGEFRKKKNWPDKIGKIAVALKKPFE